MFEYIQPTPDEMRELATPEVVKALRVMAETGACSLNPPIFGAFTALGVFTFGAAQVLAMIEEMEK